MTGMTGLLNAYQPAHERPTLLARVTSNAAIALFAVVAGVAAILSGMSLGLGGEDKRMVVLPLVAAR